MMFVIIYRFQDEVYGFFFFGLCYFRISFKCVLSSIILQVEQFKELWCIKRVVILVIDDYICFDFVVGISFCLNVWEVYFRVRFVFVCIVIRFGICGCEVVGFFVMKLGVFLFFIANYWIVWRVWMKCCCVFVVLVFFVF